MSFWTQHGHLGAIQKWFSYLTKQHYILSNPAADLDLPKVRRKLPRFVLTVEEVEQVLNTVKLHEPLGPRDRAILETFYSTGIRRSELINLCLYDLDVTRDVLTIREGKGKKDRMIPIGPRAQAWIRKYVEDVRPGLVMEPDEGTLFLTVDGEPFSQNHLTKIVRLYIRQSGIGKQGSCHLFRHTMATLMLEGGADLRYIQSMLGHAEISSTEIYTHVAIKKLKEIYLATHPGAKLKKEKEVSQEDSAG